MKYSMEGLKKRWLAFAIGGLILCGAGLSVFGKALLLYGGEGSFWSWFGLGTLSLVLFNAGLSVFGQGVIYRLQLLQAAKEEKLAEADSAEKK